MDTPLLDAAFWITSGAVLVLLVLSAFFSGSETALTAASRGKLRPERDQNLVVSYWRAGASDEEHVAAKKAEAAKA